MKKILTTLLISILFLFIVTGCIQDDNTASVIANNLDKNLNKLRITVNKLDSVDNNTISNPDIYSSFTASKNNKLNNLTLASLQINNSTKREIVSKILFDKILEKQQNNNCNMVECEKYCDENGVCYYKDCLGNCYTYNQDGTCENCDNIPTTCSFVGQTQLYSNDSKDILNHNNEGEFTIEKLSLENNSDTENQTNNSELINTPNPRFMFYFSQDSFSPIKLKYNPRYVSEYSEETINDQIENYLFKVQKLYAMTEDTIEANIILQECKMDVLECIDEIRELNKCIINGECDPSIQELQAIKSYIHDIKKTTQRLRDCNGELREELTNISEENSTTLVNSVDVMNSNYLRLINHLDTRITYHKSAIATLEQIKYLLDNSINGEQIPEEDLEEIIESLTTENVDTNISSENNDEDINQNVDQDDSVVNDNSSDDSTTVVDTNNSSTDTETTTNSNDEDVTINDEENVEASTDNALTNETFTESENNNMNDLNVDENNTEEDSDDAINTEEGNEDNNSSIIDSYNDNSWSNIDTYKNNESSEDVITDNEIISENTDEILNEENTGSDSTPIENNIDTSENEAINDTAVIENQNTVAPEINTTTPIVHDNLYTNSVITQNNLNNDDGYGGYYYTADGEIKNNGINNNNEMGNNGNTIETNMTRNNNVNTYGYNTILDILNQGTVNNGINTL